MDTVKVKKDRLLETMKLNRDNHRGIFESAWEKYAERAMLEAQTHLDEMKAGGPIHLVINLPTPVDYTEQYNDAIARFEWHEGDEIELDSGEFKQYVLDKWGWEASFALNTRSYTG